MPLSERRSLLRMAARSSRKWVRPFLYTAGLATGASGAILYISYRPRNIPGSDPAAVPPRFGPDGTIAPPRFPKVRSRSQQIADLKWSGGGQGNTDLSKGPSRAFFGKRDEATDELTGVAEPYDLLIIGGGATGTGIALDAVTRGLKVAVVERDDFSSGTSSKSTKLVHGGVRYLEKAVWELDYNQYECFRDLQAG